MADGDQRDNELVKREQDQRASDDADGADLPAMLEAARDWFSDLADRDADARIAEAQAHVEIAKIDSSTDREEGKLSHQRWLEQHRTDRWLIAAVVGSSLVFSFVAYLKGDGRAALEVLGLVVVGSLSYVAGKARGELKARTEEERE